jgi:four helix bundle protein
MTLTADQLRNRTRGFAVRIVKLFRALPKTTEAQVLGKQLMRSGTSVAANYRAACRGRSRPEFIAKLGVVAEEADETVFWLEMLVDCEIVREALVAELAKEARELCAIFSASQHTAKARR